MSIRVHGKRSEKGRGKNRSKQGQKRTLFRTKRTVFTTKRTLFPHKWTSFQRKRTHFTSITQIGKGVPLGTFSLHQSPPRFRLTNRLAIRRRKKFLCRRIVRPYTHFVVGGLQRRRHTETYLSHARMVVSHYLEKRFKRGTREVDFLGVMCFCRRIGFRQPRIRVPAEMHQRPPLHQPIEHRKHTH